ncbi:MAG: endolytic transglycosylase MltG [Elusimicrobia bacterium]|nr:endolytic transglycosylase MltG [Elusimicrobiota bacterium]
MRGKWFLLVLIAAGGIIGTALLTASWYLPATPVLLEIPAGAHAKQVSALLAQKGLIVSPWFFRGLVKVTGQSRRLHAGTYRFSPRRTSWHFLWAIARGRTYRVKVTIPEGWTAAQIAHRLQALGVTDATAFLAIVRAEQLEGKLFPETYFLTPHSAPAQVTNVFLSGFERRAKPLMDSAGGRAGRGSEGSLSAAQILTLASIIEREARTPAERPLIAGVFYNRLKRGWSLESDPTVQYALGIREGTLDYHAPLTYDDLEVESPYNTYRYPGLPPGPICNPGLASIHSALAPAKTDAMFFVADGQGTHRFSRYYQEHLEQQHR